MEKPLNKGDVVVLPFPFSDLSCTKRRPALVIANLIGEDAILCQITSKTRLDGYSVILEENEFKEGRLNVASMIRPDKLFTGDKNKILYKIGRLNESKMKEVEDSIIQIIKS